MGSEGKGRGLDAAEGMEAVTVALAIFSGVILCGAVLTSGLLAFWYWPELGERFEEWRMERALRRQKRELRKTLNRGKR